MKKFLLFAMSLVLCFAAQAKTFKITADSWIVADDKGTVLRGEKTHNVRSIASITKLMTAMVVIDSGQDLNEKIGQYTRRDLIQMALVRSDNHAADLLCDSYSGGKAYCIRDMNIKASKLGMNDTHYTEPTGLSVFNRSTAEDLVKLVLAASAYDEIKFAAKTPQYRVSLRKRILAFNNTNPLVNKHEFLVSKTGYINASGGCIALMVKTEVGHKIVILLGSKNTRTRIPEAEYIFKNY